MVSTAPIALRTRRPLPKKRTSTLRRDTEWRLAWVGRQEPPSEAGMLAFILEMIQLLVGKRSAHVSLSVLDFVR